MKTFLSRVLIAIVVIAAYILTTGSEANAQKVGEWITVDSLHKGRMNVVQLDVDAAGPGDYIVLAQEDATIGPYVIRHTTDAGITWNIVRADSGIKWRLIDISHPTPNSIIAIGDTSTLVSGNTYKRHPFVLYSQDAGTTWGRVELPEDVYIPSISMYDGVYGAMLGVRTDAGNKTKYLIFTTKDGGVSWQIQYPELGSYSLSNIVCLSPSGMALLGYDSQTDASVFFRTTNGGVEWQSYTRPSTISTIDFVDSLNGWGAGGRPTGIGDTQTDFIAHTTDGGKTWQTIIDKPIEFQFGLRDIDFADELHGIAVGGYGKILRTTDGGLSWIQDWPSARLIAEYVDTRKIAYAAPDEAIVSTGFSGYVLKYTGRQKLPAPKITEPSHNLAELPLNLTVRWTTVQDAELYDFQVADTTYEYNNVNHHMFDVPYIDVFGVTRTDQIVQLDPHTRYIFRVRARNATDTSDWSIYLYAISRDVGQNLVAPYFIAPEMGATDVQLPVTLLWNSVEGATGYDLVVVEKTVIQGALVVNETNLQSTSYVTSSLKPGMTYIARVRARDDNGFSNWSTSDKGSLQFTVSASSNVIEPKQNAGMELQIMPNPITESNADLTTYIATAGAYRITLVNAIGEEMMVLADRRFDRGEIHMPVSLVSVPAGCYFVCLTGSDKVQHIPVVITRH